MNCYMYNQFYWYTGDSYMIFRGPSFFPQILQNIKSVLRQKYFSYDILYLLIKDVEVDFSIVLLMTTYKPLQN